VAVTNFAVSEDIFQYKSKGANILVIGYWKKAIGKYVTKNIICRILVIGYWKKAIGN